MWALKNNLYIFGLLYVTVSCLLLCIDSDSRSCLIYFIKLSTLEHFHTSFSDNYLFADSSDAKVLGKPLVYTTRYMVPSAKCLRFWYHMQGENIGTLAVNIFQKNHVYSEIFRVTGDQGTNWKKATVNIDSIIRPSGSQFKVSILYCKLPLCFRARQLNFVVLCFEPFCMAFLHLHSNFTSQLSWALYFLLGFDKCYS